MNTPGHENFRERVILWRERGALNLPAACQKSGAMKRAWKVHVARVYRMDREGRLRQAYAIVVPESVSH